MKLILLILGIAVIALNVFLWYSKRQRNPTTADKSSGHKKTPDGSDTHSNEFLNSPEAAALKQAAANELGISIERLNLMSAEEIELLATEKELI